MPTITGKKDEHKKKMDKQKAQKGGTKRHNVILTASHCASSRYE